MARTTKSYRFLVYQDRLKIQELNGVGLSPADIAKEIGCTVSTIYNELRRGETGEIVDGIPVYDAVKAQRSVRVNLSRRGANNTKGFANARG